jgi:hypothetical protein
LDLEAAQILPDIGSTVSTQSIRLETPFRAPWIISGRDDLTWFIGSSLVSYAVLALMAAGFPLTPLYLIWLVGIDGPHVLATVTRTYFDKRERRRLGPLLWIVIPALFRSGRAPEPVPRSAPHPPHAERLPERGTVGHPLHALHSGFENLARARQQRVGGGTEAVKDPRKIQSAADEHG